ncbi:MAG TPA: BON domain-containing protein [Armatimonadota bacterium]|nr:BON domain-containing protein [Armatimonadota bacterium]
METWGDHLLSLAVESALANEPELQGTHIEVEVCQGVVTLNGIVRTMAQRERATFVADNFGGVTELRNALQISP